MEESTILVETNGNIGIITLNRPDKANAISLAMLNDISYQVQTWEYDDSIRAIVIKGQSNVFASGIDIAELSAEVTQQSFALKAWKDEFAKIAHCAKPLIAAVSGYALGIGCDLALACDIILASESAQFGYPEVSIGFIPSFGGCTRLVHAIGRAKTMEAVLTGKAIGAEEASACGLISRVVNLVDLDSEVLKVAMRIASQPYQAVIQAKETISQVEDMNLSNGFELESKSCRLSLNTPEFQQILAQFEQKM